MKNQRQKGYFHKKMKVIFPVLYRKINYPREREEIVELLLNTGESKFSHTIENVAFITEG